MSKIPVAVLVTTRNEEARIVPCLQALQDFSEIVVIDSASTDRTVQRAQVGGARVVNFVWDKTYPKKRQWCLDHLELAHDWILFIDADEMMTSALADEIRQTIKAPACSGYFIKGRYVVAGQVLRHGLCNDKLVLFDRRCFRFPVVNDLDIQGMGEMEGHYQPVAIHGEEIGRLKSFMLHYAYNGGESWEARHRRYAQWEADMNARQAWPVDPVASRQKLKEMFRALPCRGLIAFVYSYLVKGGFLDGVAGFRLARDRYRYYVLVARSRQ
ncbi:MAG: glycosyltransferase family 2 protein [Alphaproteobacteria bacterium]|nr:glycosyltransferase family 2 protein [Alphaproteobacteria bacterium]